MQVNNNTQPLQFTALALKRTPKMQQSLEQASSEVIKSIEDAGEILKNTKFYHVVVDDKLKAKIISDKDAYFGPFKYDAYASDKSIMYPNTLILSTSEDGYFASVERHIPANELIPEYKVENLVGACDKVEHVKALSIIADLFDKVAVEKYKSQLPEDALNAFKQEVKSTQVGNLLDKYGV